MCGVYELTKKVDLLRVIQSANLPIPPYRRIEENQAAHARPDSALVEDRQGRSKAAAVGDDDDRHPGECECALRIAVHSRELDGRFIKEASEAVRLPEFPGARIGGIDGKLRRHQHRVHSGGRDLCRHLLAVADVLGEIGTVAVKKHDHDRGTFGVEAWRNVQQHAVVTESLRLPENMAAEIDVAPVALSTGIQKRLARCWHGAVIWEGRRFEINETCQCAGVGWDARGNGLRGRCDAFEGCQPDRRLQTWLRLFRRVFR